MRESVDALERVIAHLFDKLDQLVDWVEACRVAAARVEALLEHLVVSERNGVARLDQLGGEDGVRGEVGVVVAEQDEAGYIEICKEI